MTRATALDAGFTRGQLRAALDRRLLESPRHGLLRLAPDAVDDSGIDAPLTATSGGAKLSTESLSGRTARSDAILSSAERLRTEHLDAVRAAQLVIGSDAMASHGSAAIVHRLPATSAGRPQPVELVLPGAPNWAGPGVVVRGSAIPRVSRVVVDGVPTTDVARTAIDLARGRHLATTLVALDAASRLLIAQRAHPTTVLRQAVHDPRRRDDARHKLAESLSSCWGWPGTKVVRAALPLVEPAAESPLESRSRAWFIEAKLPPLGVGVPIRCAGRQYWADFADVERRVIGEADGFTKYGAEVSEVRDRLLRERQRQSDLEADGWRVVRWLSSDAREVVVRRMATALGVE